MPAHAAIFTPVYVILLTEERQKLSLRLHPDEYRISARWRLLRGTAAKRVLAAVQRFRKPKVRHDDLTSYLFGAMLACTPSLVGVCILLREASAIELHPPTHPKAQTHPSLPTRTARFFRGGSVAWLRRAPTRRGTVHREGRPERLGRDCPRLQQRSQHASRLDF